MTSPTSVAAARRAPKVTVTHPERVLFPADGITKGDLVGYYRDVAKVILPYVEDRPLTLQRYPGGIAEPSFFEKNAPRGLPEWVKTADMPSSGPRKTVKYIVCDDVATLAYVANLAAITLHVWMSRLASIDRPDFLLFDLDPWEGCTAKTLAEVALAVRATLDEIALPPRVKTTGGKGLHVIVPLRPEYTYETVRSFGEVIARRVAAANPDKVTLARSKERRKQGTVYLDYVQMGQGKTLVPPYAVRARDGAPVSTPLEWSEVEELRSSRARETTRPLAKWNLATVRDRLATQGDVWDGAFAKGSLARLEPALAKARAAWGKITAEEDEG